MYVHPVLLDYNTSIQELSHRVADLQASLSCLRSDVCNIKSTINNTCTEHCHLYVAIQGVTCELKGFLGCCILQTTPLSSNNAVSRGRLTEIPSGWPCQRTAVKGVRDFFWSQCLMTWKSTSVHTIIKILPLSLLVTSMLAWVHLLVLETREGCYSNGSLIETPSLSPLTHYCFLDQITRTT